ncbi:uncharacterized protein LOC142242972 [Haematobia irritans]|uniref:uncharacterized protein LOC142242972 n=1 Tax=Haematobia irritans TaxID=7368 RepID=UPI003F4FBF23
MRTFIALCLVATVCAQSGYNYGKGGSGLGGNSLGSGLGSGLGGINLGGAVSGASSSLDDAPFFDVLHADSGSSKPSSSGLSFGDSSSSPSFGASSSSPSFASPSSGSSFGSSSPSFGDSVSPAGAASFDSPAVQGSIEKQFITYTANDEDFHDPQATNEFANSVKQGLRVVFIKGPDTSGLENAALALAKNAANQETAIYVLNKQADLAALANKLNSENSNANNKPDVHFVKYRTPEDAENAQKTIQAEYNALGGKSENIDGGVATSLNFASQAPLAPASQGSFGAATSPSYLPASIFRRFRY